MLRTSSKIPNSRIASLGWSSFLATAAALLVASSGPAAAQGSGAQGRQTAPLLSSGANYERKRIKRTVTLTTLADWDILYDTPEARVYFDWDDQSLFFAVVTRGAQEASIDVDAQGDGWFRGAENFSIRAIPAGEGIRTLVRRYDTLQNKEQPVWAEVPQVESQSQATILRNDQEVATLLRVPISLLGPKRRVGMELGLGVRLGLSALTDPTPDTSFLRLQLVEESEAILGTLSARVSVRDRKVVAGGTVRGTLELRHTGPKPLLLKKVILPDGSVVTNERDPILVLNPGERLRRDFRFVLGEGAEPSSVVLRGGAEREDGTGEVVALLSITRQEPYALALDYDDRPIATAAPDGPARRRLLVASVLGRRESKSNGQLTLSLPAGWTLEGDLKRTFSLSYPGEQRHLSFKLVIPMGTPAGVYAVHVLCEVGGRAYRDQVEVRVQ